MLTPIRALAQRGDEGALLPRVKAFEPLYRLGCHPRRGDLIMIAGRSGSQKSGLALYWTAAMGLPTLYLSADMQQVTASARLAAMGSGDTFEEVSKAIESGNMPSRYAEKLAGLPMTFSFDSPITWDGLDAELDAFVELHNEYPSVIVVDNLMDIAEAESDYTAQMAAMASITELGRATGAAVFVLHHASDKTWSKVDPWLPPSRSEIKGGLSEKPTITLTVALNPDDLTYRVAVVKNRSGPCDPSGQTYALLWADPARTRFYDRSPLNR